MLHRGESLTYVAKTLCAARSSVGRWINWFTLFGIDGLKSLPAGRQKKWPVEEMLRMLDLLVQRSPQDFGYLRSRWSTEMLTIEINKLFNATLHPGSLRRWLPAAGIVWRRAAPTLHIRDPYKRGKLAAISDALEKNCADHPVFTRMKSILISTLRLAPTGKRKVNRSAFLRRLRIKSITLPELFTREPAEWSTSAGQARTQACSSICYAS